jgi:excinuclease UvrABC ATPase subunit
MCSGGGTEVGHIVATGTPQQIAESENRVTGRFLI